MKKLVCVMVFGALTFCLALGSAQARPQYFKSFGEEYPNVKEAATAKCAVCHEGEGKKVRNAYGKAVGGAVGAANEKDVEKIKAALKKVAEEHKEFGEKLKDGKLPK
jgi:hypothetical protein